MKNTLENIVRIWVGKNLPTEHIWVNRKQKPKGIYKNIRMYFRKWIIHPIRRNRTHVYSNELSKKGCTIIGITGSAGKTTTKEMLATVLSSKYKTVWSKENIDPVYNIPETLLMTPKDTQILILEMGVEFPGEIDFYTWLAKPKIGVLTSVDWTHTEFFGSVDGVLEEKQKLITNLPADGYAILNYDDLRVRGVADKTNAKVIFFGSSKNCHVRFSNISLTSDCRTNFKVSYKNTSIRISLPLLGNHFASLSCAAIAVGLIYNLSLSQMKRRLESIKNQPHRMQPINLRNNILLLDDTYNANPFATREALKILNEIAKNRRKVFVFGEMKELGEYAIKGHKDIGLEVCSKNVSELITIGNLTKHTIVQAVKGGLNKKNVYQSKDNDDLFNRLKTTMKNGDVVLIKASRSMGLDNIVNRILDEQK